MLRRTDDLTTPTDGHPYLGGMSLDEFNDGMDVAHSLLSRQPWRREHTALSLATMSPWAVRLAAYTIEEAICDHSATDDDIEMQMEVVAALVRRVGRDAAPVLDDLATNGSCNLAVNDWAQELLFEVLGLDGDARRRACHHRTMTKERRGGRDVWVCLHCDGAFGDDGRPVKGNGTPKKGKKRERS